MTVYTNRPYRQVDDVTVILNVIEVSVIKSGARGYFVVKCQLDSVKAIIAPPEATLVFKGLMKDDTAFTGSDVV